MSRAASLVLAFLLSGGLLVGCADTAAPFDERSGSSVPPDGEVDASGSWTNVIAGERMTLNALIASAPFDVVIPSGLGDPIGAYLLDIEEQSPGQSVVEFDYDVEGIGRVVVEEATPEVPRSEWKDYIDLLVSQNGSEMMQGTATFVEVRGGSPALMTTSADGSASDIRWLESDVLEVYVRGPMLSSEECLKLAEQV